MARGSEMLPADVALDGISPFGVGVWRVLNRISPLGIGVWRVLNRINALRDELRVPLNHGNTLDDQSAFPRCCRGFWDSRKLLLAHEIFLSVACAA